MRRFLLLGILALAAPAWAQEQPTVAVVGLHQAGLTPEDQARAVSAMTAAIAASGKGKAVGPDAFATAIRGREKVILEEGLLQGGRANLQLGRNFYNSAQPEDAAPMLELSIDELRLSIAATNTVADLWEAYVLFGTSKLSLGDEDAARNAFGQAAALNPGREPSPVMFPPDVVGLYQSVRDDGKGKLSSLEVTSDGPARLFLDGVERGEAPQSIEGVLPGEHHLVARGERTQSYARVLVEAPVGAAPKVRVELEMQPPTLGSAEASKSGRSRQVAELYTALGTRANGVDYMLMAGVDAGTLHLQLFHPATRAFSAPVEVPATGPGDDEAATTLPLLMAQVGPAGLAQTSATAVPLDVGSNSMLAQLLTQPSETKLVVEEPLPPKEPKKGKGGLIAGIVVGAAVVGAGVAVGAVLLHEPNRGVINVSF